jgi:hypothetical protein
MPDTSCGLRRQALTECSVVVHLVKSAAGNEGLPPKFFIASKMDPKKIEQCLESVLSCVQLEKGGVEGAIKTVRLYGNEYSITKWDDEKFNGFVKDIIKLFPKHCPKFVKESASSTLASILIDRADGKISLRQWTSRLLEWMQSVLKQRYACIPIEGIELRLGSIDFGFGTLYRSNEGLLPTLITNEKAYYSWQHRINALESCEAYFQVELDSDHENLKRTALLRTKYLCALLSLFVGSSQYRTGYKTSPWYERIKEAEVQRRRKIEIWAAESGESQVYYEFHDNKDEYRKADHALHFNFLLSGHDGSEALDECLRIFREDRAKATHHLVDERVVKEIFLSDNKRLLTCISNTGDIDRKLFNSVSWFGKAVNAESEEDQFLFFAIAIECLLVGDEKKSPNASQGSITQKMSERAAFLISDEFGERKKAEAEVKSLYDIRSKIVHGGAAATYVDVIRIEKIARMLILKYAQMDFQSSEQFLEWITAKRYG